MFALAKLIIKYVQIRVNHNRGNDMQNMEMNLVLLMVQAHQQQECFHKSLIISKSGSNIAFDIRMGHITLFCNRKSRYNVFHNRGHYSGSIGSFLFR
jgi:hypothetical protein